MDGARFDALVRELLGDGSRRGLLRRLSALPLAGGLASLLEEESIAKKRRAKRRRDHGAASERKRHKRHKRHKRKCKSKAKVCAGKCGIVRYTCHKKKRTANCGPCACDPPCGECLTCDAENGVCIPDPTQTGDDCGETGQICQPDGQCRCDATSCPACATCQGTGVCTSPCGGAGCCAQGTCEDGDTPEACGAGGQTCQECGGDTPFCEDGGCVGCSGANPCPGGQVCCGGSCLAGDCCNDEQCGNATPLCLNNTCTGCTSAAQCQSAGLGDLCCGGSCVSGVCCDVTDCEPGGNACVGNQCQCGGGALCDVPTPDCCDPGTCTNVETDPNNCGVCGIVCPLDLPVCVNGSCTPCSGANPCPSGQVCCGVCLEGNCCDNSGCSGDTPLCENNICTACASNQQCQSAGLGDLCCDGACVSGICCADSDCEPPGNTCVGNQCQCGSGAVCSEPTPDCCGDPGTCTNTQTDPDHCDFCGNACLSDNPVCWNGACVCGNVCTDGSCQFTTVQAAIDAAFSGETILICAGTYTRGGGSPVASIDQKNLTLIGAGSGSGGTVFDGGNVATDDGIVDCQQSTVVLQGISVTGANGGYAIGNSIGTLTLEDVIVTGNTNDNAELGGAIFNDGGTLILNAGATVTGNTTNSSSSGGGGINTDGGSITLNAGSQVSSNNAPSGNGGGIYSLQGTVTLNAGSAVTDNTAGNSGGGIYNLDGTVVVNSGANLSGNEAPPGTENDCVDVDDGTGCP